MLDLRVRDRNGNQLNTGSVCVRMYKNGWEYNMEHCVYIGRTTCSTATGKYGRFLTKDGIRSLKLTSVLYCFDMINSGVSTTETITNMIRKVFEG